MRVLFLKAQVPGGAGGDLLAAPVLVRGYTRKDGVVVPSHASTRTKAAKPARPSTPVAPRAEALPQAERDVAETAWNIPPAEAAPDGLLSVSPEHYAAAVVGLAHAKLRAGGAIALGNRVAVTHLNAPAHADALRARGAFVELSRGARWDALVGEGLDQLAVQVGAPTALARAEVAGALYYDTLDARLAQAEVVLRPLILAREITRVRSLRSDAGRAEDVADRAAYEALRAAAKPFGLDLQDFAALERHVINAT